ncbi:HNH endonuclease [Aliarcobacter cryaerophilus]|uniref:HNH endonuclease n=1 Tax=Aliarcobacter cryaerophilus TaxID=28198 RepID=UPI003DA5556A
MQVHINNTSIFQATLQQIFSLKNRVAEKINFMNNRLQKKGREVDNELAVSNNFLNIARAYEMQKQAILAEKTVKLTRALQQEAAALASGNPLAIAAATAYVAKATHEKMIALQEFQKARENRINMERRVEIVNKAKYHINTLSEQTKIQLNSLYLHIDGLTQIVHSRLVKSDLLQNDYLSQNIVSVQDETIYKNIPQNGGAWSGQPGNSKWIPNKEDIPKQPYGNEKTWGEILKKHNIDGIVFKDGEPDFTPIAEGSVEIEDFTINRDDNFFQADQNLAQQWKQEVKNGKNDWTISDVREYRKEKKLTWHERSDMKSMDLVSQEVHGNIPHSGGISKKKRLEMEEKND